MLPVTVDRAQAAAGTPARARIRGSDAQSRIRDEPRQAQADNGKERPKCRISKKCKHTEFLLKAVFFKRDFLKELFRKRFFLF